MTTSGPTIGMPSARADRAARAVGGDEVAGGDDALAHRPTSRSVARTPSGPASRPTTSVAELDAGGADERRCASSTRSRWSCGTHAGAVGLISAACSRVGSPTSIAGAPSARASVSQLHISQSTSTPPASTSSSSPQARSSSIERVLITVARGSGDGSARRSTSRHSTPWRASIVAAASPAGPAPTISTGTSFESRISNFPFGRTACL